MRAKNTTPFLFGSMATSLRPPQPAITLIVKGTFRLRPGEPVTPLEGTGAQGTLSGDVFAPDDDDRRGPLSYASDFADFKPRADVIVQASCHVPGGKALPECPVRVAVGAWSKILRVVGPRVWVESVLGDVPSDAVPFTTLPIDWAHALGGPDHGDNPIGRGIGTRELHCIEAAGEVVRRPSDRFAPAGFGPMSPLWPQRRAKVGKAYGASWREKRAPYVAEDFDWSYFNAAPADQQLAAIRGDEEIAFTNLHPAAPSFSAKLPALRVRAFLLDDGGRAREVIMRLDTLLADLDREVLVLTWRGVAEVREDDLADVQAALIASEPLASEPAPPQDYVAALVAFARDPLGLQTRPPWLADAPAAAGEEPPDVVGPPSDPVWEKLRGRVRDLPGPQRDRLEAMMNRLAALAPQGVDLRAKIVEALAETTSPPPVVMPRAPGSTPYVPLGHELRSMRRFVERVKDLLRENDRAGRLRDAPLDATLSRLSALEQSPAIRAFDPYFKPEGAPADEPGPGADLSGRDLSGQDLSGRDLSGANLSGALLQRAKLAGAILRGARLTHAILHEADLSGADLAEADLTLAHLGHARADEASFRGARLDQAVLEGASLRGADLSQTRGEHIALSRADLTGARAHEARFERAIVESARLAGASFAGATLVRCRFSGCHAENADFTGALIDGSSFAGARLARAIFREARGTRVVLRRAHLEHADLGHAVLPELHADEAQAAEARLSAAVLRGARFYRTSLARADLAQADLLDADLRKADLTGASLRGANLFGVRMQKSRRAGCELEGANTKRMLVEGG